MQKPHLKSALIYLVLVGVPVLGILAVLHVGRDLQAPPYVAGQWALQLDSTAAAPCPRLHALLGRGLLSVTQSGPQLVLIFDSGRGAALAGGIQVAAIAAEGRADNASDACGGSRIYFQAQLDDKPLPKRLAGTLSAPECAGCQPVAFTASLQPPGPTEGH